MAQVIAPEVWQEGINDNTLLPGRYTVGLFTGKGVNIANNASACRVWDIMTTDYITDYDDRRINGLNGTNPDGRDGWGASAYGVFQDLKLDSRVYTMGRHRSCAFRIFDEDQYSGEIGDWGTATSSNISDAGQELLNTARKLSLARERWEKEVLGPDIDKYNLFAILNGHISGRWVADNPDRVFDGNGRWVAQPGPVQGQSIPPRFAPIHGVEWDDENIPLMLHTIKTTWTNLFIEQTNRVCVMDPFYEYNLMMALTGKGVPPTEAAYADIQNGSFVRLMGWDFDFSIPTEYWPQLYFDANLNVVHSADGKAAYDSVINSINGGADDDPRKLQRELVASDRMNRNNFVRTFWNRDTGKFEKVVTNYPLGMPSTVPYLGEPIEVPYDNFGKPTNYPWTGPGGGYGIDNPTGPQGEIVRRQVIGMFLYKPAAQLSQEYSEMRTAEGETRGKFTEMVTDVKYDAWVIENLSHGIIPIIDAKANLGVTGIPVKIVEDLQGDPIISSIKVTATTSSLRVGQETMLNVQITGTGRYDRGYRCSSSNANVVTVSDTGVVKAVGAGTAVVTVAAIGDPTKTATISITVVPNNQTGA